MSGQRWAIPVPEPLVFEIWEEDEGEGEMLPMFKTHFLLMTDKLVNVLNESGVDNLDCYDAVIRQTRIGREYRNYRAVNIVGLVRAADMAKSESIDLGLGTGGLVSNFFRRLELDESTIGGALLFRLAEKISAIVVHESVKHHLLAKGFDRLSFVEPSKYRG
jgi:hypothetical protein